MAVELTSAPSFPQSLYRPLQYVYTSAPPTPVAVTFIRVANSSDVSSFPTLIEGESILVEHSALTGTAIGQHVVLSSTGDWSGVRKITEVLDSTHTVLDGGSYADYSSGGTIGIYRNNHRFVVYLWHDDTETTPRVSFKVTPNESGVATFSINTGLKSRKFIDPDGSLLHSVVTANLTSSGFISTEYLSSVIFRIQVLEGYDVPTDGINEWTLFGAWDPESGTPRCAVNGVHPYDHDYPSEANAQLDWAQPRMIDYVLNADPVARFLTYGPRAALRKMAPTETGRLVVLLSSDNDFEGGEEYRVVLYGYDAAGIPTNIGSSDVFTIPANVSSFAIPTGPAELTTLVVPDFPIANYASYAVQIAVGASGGAVTEFIRFTYDPKCSEARRRFHWLNKLGGIDDVALTKREIASTKVKRSTLSKPYAAGTGYDFRQRVYRTDPARAFTITSEPIKPAVRRWLAEDLLESASVLTTNGGARLSPVIVTTDALDAFSTEDKKAPLSFQFQLGVDNLSQEA